MNLNSIVIVDCITSFIASMQKLAGSFAGTMIRRRSVALGACGKNHAAASCQGGGTLSSFGFNRTRGQLLAISP